MLTDDIRASHWRIPYFRQSDGVFVLIPRSILKWGCNYHHTQHHTEAVVHRLELRVKPMPYSNWFAQTRIRFKWYSYNSSPTRSCMLGHCARKYCKCVYASPGNTIGIKRYATIINPLMHTILKHKSRLYSCWKWTFCTSLCLVQAVVHYLQLEM